MNSLSSVEDIISACRDLHSYSVIEVALNESAKTQVEQVLKELNYFVVCINENIKNKDELLQALDKACHFPDYFGFNWDALIDSLTDFHWQPADGYILMIEDMSRLKQADLDTFLEIVSEVNKKWAKHGIPFKLLALKGSF